jgi:hypothetical protein
MRHGAASASLQREWRVDPPKKRFFGKILALEAPFQGLERENLGRRSVFMP